jgi:hypothetical protein
MSLLKSITDLHDTFHEIGTLFRCKKINPKPNHPIRLFYNTNANLINSPHYIFVYQKSKHNVECSRITNNTGIYCQERQSYKLDL